MNKINSYIGLSLKSGSVVIGQDNLKKYKKKIFLIIVSLNATNNLKDLSLRLGEKFKVKVIVLNELLEEIIKIANCKIIGITNENLAKAIINTNDYTEVKE